MMPCWKGAGRAYEQFSAPSSLRWESLCIAVLVKGSICPGLSCLWASTHKGRSQEATAGEAGGEPAAGGELQPNQASLRGSSLEVSCPAAGAHLEGTGQAGPSIE